MYLTAESQDVNMEHGAKINPSKLQFIEVEVLTITNVFPAALSLQYITNRGGGRVRVEGGGGGGGGGGGVGGLGVCVCVCVCKRVKYHKVA